MFDFSRILSAEYVKANGILWDEDLFTYESYWENGYNHYERLFDKPMDEGGKPVTALIYELFSDGTLSDYAYYKDGYKYGEDVKFYKSGRVSGYTLFMDSEFYLYEWYENGQIKEFFERYRDDNKYFRRMTCYDENGNKISKSINCEVNFSYKYNEPDNRYDVTFHDNGEFRKIIWKNPDRSTFYKSAEFDEKGYPVNFEINAFYNPEYRSLKDNKVSWNTKPFGDKFRFSGGILEYAYSEKYFSAFTGKVYFCYPIVEVHKVNEYEKGVLYGEQLEYYKSGQIAEEYHLTKNSRHYAKHYWWYRNGVLKEVAEYKNDGTIYKVTQFDEDGNKLR
ncbi:MAG: hypothetical protein NC040_01445 [Muribaculaceae bacterium]|nr:hypothetical protein [Muribaculaceae bacterium]